MNQRLDYQMPDSTMLNVQAKAFTTIAIIIAVLPVVTVHAQSRTYTTTADFDSAYLINSDGVDDDADGELAIRTVPQTLPYIWVACSERGTVVRIDTQTRQVVGEYLSAPTNPDGSLLCGRNPSRTTVDFDGNLWAGNRDDTDGKGSVVKIASGFAFQWRDYDNDTILDTSTGLGDAAEKTANRLDSTRRGHVYTYRTFVGRRSVETAS